MTQHLHFWAFIPDNCKLSLPKNENTQTSFSGWRTTNVVGQHHGILLSNKKGQTIDAKTWMNLQRPMLSERKPIPEVTYSMIPLKTFVSFFKWQNYKNGFRELEVGRRREVSAAINGQQGSSRWWDFSVSWQYQYPGCDMYCSFLNIFFHLQFTFSIILY